NSSSLAPNSTIRWAWRSQARMLSSVCDISEPYAPTFCTGVAPVEPGIPESASMPLSPLATDHSTTASQCWPAAMRTWTSAGVDSIISMPLVAMRTTVPGKPSSATNMFDPPASTSSGVLAVSVSAMAVISCSSVEATTQVVAGPPTRAVVWFASKFSGIRLELHHRSSSSEYSSIVVMGVSYREVNAHYVSLVIDVCDSCGNFQLCPWVGIIERSSRVSCMCGLFYRNHRRKPSLVIDDGPRIIGPL